LKKGNVEGQRQGREGEKRRGKEEKINTDSEKREDAKKGKPRSKTD